MAQTRRMGAEDSQVRARFVDAAEAVLSEEGEHGISARLVAARAGLKTQLLYYYFRTMDDLLVAVVQQVNERRLASFEQALASPEPLRAMWAAMSDPAAAGLAAALSSMAHHRPAVRTAVNSAAQQFRALQTKVVGELVPPPTSGELEYSPGGIVMIAAALARMLVNESKLGLTAGHAEAVAIVEQLLTRWEADATASGVPG